MDDMWITVENERVSGDFALGISKVKVKSSSGFLGFPQLTPQLFTGIKVKNSYLVRKVICNYKEVVLLTHLLTAVITTNFKYKNLSRKLRSFQNLQLTSSSSGATI